MEIDFYIQSQAFLYSLLFGVGLGMLYGIFKFIRVAFLSTKTAVIIADIIFMLIASMNPCACGYYGSKDKECTCSPQSIAKYMGKISGPLLDRIDIHIEVTPVKYQKLQEDAKMYGITIHEMLYLQYPEVFKKWK